MPLHTVLGNFVFHFRPLVGLHSYQSHRSLATGILRAETKTAQRGDRGIHGPASHIPSICSNCRDRLLEASLVSHSNDIGGTIRSVPICSHTYTAVFCDRPEPRISRGTSIMRY